MTQSPAHTTSPDGTALTSNPRTKGLTGFALKVAAILGMTANHVAHAFIAQLPVAAVEALYWFGGLTFPIMAFLLVEGYRHTSSVPRYLARLLLFAALSQIPFTLLFGWTANVLVTLAIGLGLIWFHDTVANPWARFGVLIAALALSIFCDWAILGPTMIYLFHVLRLQADGAQGESRRILLTMAIPYAVTVLPALSTLIDAAMSGSANAATTVGFFVSFESFADASHMAGLPLEFANTLMMQICQLGYALVGFTLATLLLLSYNGHRGYPLKWAFYAYYPAHLLVIWAVKTLAF